MRKRFACPAHSSSNCPQSLSTLLVLIPSLLVRFFWRVFVGGVGSVVGGVVVSVVDSIMADVALALTLSLALLFGLYHWFYPWLHFLLWRWLCYWLFIDCAIGPVWGCFIVPVVAVKFSFIYGQGRCHRLAYLFSILCINLCPLLNSPNRNRTCHCLPLRLTQETVPPTTRRFCTRAP